MASSGRGRGKDRSGALATLACATALAACSQSNGASVPAEAGLTDVTVIDAQSATDGGAPRDAGLPDDAGLDAAPAPTCITPTMPQACAPPEMTALPICKLSQTGCMDSSDPTRVAANAVYYEVNSPLWSDDAAKQRAFVLPDGGTIHVKNCMPDAGASALAECVSDAGIPCGPADTGKWEFPVGTVMIKSFMFGGKLVETRLLMHVDAATAAVIQNGTDWVGYNYAWNDEQTEATIVPDERTTATFDVPSEAGTQSVVWNYPSFLDCVGCHGAVVGTIGPETDQMNRVVDGGNQIDTFEARGFFDDTAPKKPYAAAMVEPYANAALGLAGPPDGSTADEQARSYLAANCGFCHRPDVNDQGFDLRYGLTLAQTGICGLMQQNGIPGTATTPFLDLAPGDHAASAMWIRMNTPVPASDPGEEYDVGRMPPVASFVVDTQAVSLVGAWIDSIASCPSSDAGM
jgi:cytochrome c551/c552